MHRRCFRLCRLSSRSLLADQSKSRTELVWGDDDSTLCQCLERLFLGCHLRPLDLLSDCIADVQCAFTGCERLTLEDVISLIILTKRSCVVEHTEKDIDVFILT